MTTYIVKDGYDICSAVPPCFGMKYPTLSEIQTYFRQLTHALRRRYSAYAFDCALRGPFNKLRSAGSQPIRLSVSAREFLSPLQRFGDNI